MIFNRALLVMADYNGFENIDDTLFDGCSFWVQFHRVLMSLRIEKLAFC